MTWKFGSLRFDTFFALKKKVALNWRGHAVSRLQDPLSTLQNSMETESRHFRNYLDLRQQKENAKLRRAMVKENN